MKKICIGILAHVDAGKTTLTESILYRSGMIRTPGRVDKGDAFLDNRMLEKKRGITIVSKQAIVDHHGLRITLIDTPGHTDLIAETERAMAVMDLAILLISAPDGVTASSRHLVQLLGQYGVPYLIYVNKTDMMEIPEAAFVKELQNELGSGILFAPSSSGQDTEDIAALSEETIEKYLDAGRIDKEDITSLLFSGKYHPVLFGSALHHEGTEELLSFLYEYTPEFHYEKETAARIFKIVYEDGHKISFAKITGGRIRVRDHLPDERVAGEKITQIRMYSGGTCRNLEEAEAGDVVALLGPENTYAGMGIGPEKDAGEMLARPVMRYRILLPENVPERTFLPKLKELSEEDPLLMVSVEQDGGITVSVMGEFQLEILSETILERFGIRIGFDRGSVILMETLKGSVIGYGHFEPLRHYAEVQLLMEPLPRGSGNKVVSGLSVDDLAINWQKTVLSTLERELPPGILTGSALTDVRFTLIGGRSHTKHTESRDFAEAARRAVRQGLMKTDCLLLEPYFEYTMILPTENLGKAMNDIRQMKGSVTIKSQDENTSTLTGRAPAGRLSHYQGELTKFTKGQGRIQMRFSGYEPLDEEESRSAVEERSYDPGNDPENPSGSVFCEHGAGVYVPWNECEARMHLPLREDLRK